MTKKELKGLSKVEESIDDAKNILCDGIELAYDSADGDDDAKFPKQAVKETLKKLVRAVTACNKVLCN